MLELSQLPAKSFGDKDASEENLPYLLLTVGNISNHKQKETSNFPTYLTWLFIGSNHPACIGWPLQFYSVPFNADWDGRR